MLSVLLVIYYLTSPSYRPLLILHASRYKRPAKGGKKKQIQIVSGSPSLPPLHASIALHDGILKLSTQIRHDLIKTLNKTQGSLLTMQQVRDTIHRHHQQLPPSEQLCISRYVPLMLVAGAWMATTSATVALAMLTASQDGGNPDAIYQL
jgi:hypothetical protein